MAAACALSALVNWCQTACNPCTTSLIILLLGKGNDGLINYIDDMPKKEELTVSFVDEEGL